MFLLNDVLIVFYSKYTVLNRKLHYEYNGRMYLKRDLLFVNKSRIYSLPICVMHFSLIK
jgi:hypothetical protein